MIERTIKLIHKKQNLNDAEENADTNCKMSIFKNLKLLPISEINTMQIAVFMYKLQNSMLPEIFLNVFEMNNKNHSYATRNANQIRTPKHSTNYVRYSVRLMGQQIWNTLDTDMKESKSQHIFQRKLKVHLLNSL